MIENGFTPACKNLNINICNQFVLADECSALPEK